MIGKTLTKEEFLNSKLINDRNIEQIELQMLEDYMNKGSETVETIKNILEKIVGIKYESKFEKGTFVGKEYSYFTDIELEKGNIVEVPTRYGKSIGMVTRIDIPEEEIQGIEEFMKVINKRIAINREEYMENGISCNRD